MSRQSSECLAMWGGVAPDYAPVPCALTRVNQTPGIQMPNVGHTIYQLLPGQCHTPLEPDEVALCILQSIHFVLLLKDRVKMEDVHSENVCVQNTKENIRLRFIDLGMWERCDEPRKTFADEIRTCWIDVVVRNAKKLFLDEDFEDNGMWREVLTECSSASEDCGYADLMAILVRTFVVDSGVNIFEILLTTAEAILDFLRAAGSVCHPPAHALVQRIGDAAGAARAALRPSRRPSFYAKKIGGPRLSA